MCGPEPDERWEWGEGNPVDATIYPDEAKRIHVTLDGVEIYGLLESLMAKLDDRELDQIHWSLFLLSCSGEAFDQVDDATLVRLLAIPEARELTVRVGDAMMLVHSLSCAVALELERRVTARGEDPHP